MSLATELETFFDAKQKIWSGREENPIFHKDISVGQVSLCALGTKPEKVIQICDTTGDQMTCQTLAQLGIKVAQNLKPRHDLQQEDIIGIMANNTTNLAPVVLGAFLIGATISPVHYALDKNTVKHIFGLTKPKIVFCDKEAYEALMEGLKDIGLKCKLYTLRHHIDGVTSVEELFEEIETQDHIVPVVLRNGDNQTAAILCSSGTTGLPKGVCISHRQLLCRNDFAFMGPDDVLFTFSTLYWISGLWILVRSLTTAALRVITDQPFSAELFLEIIEKHKITQLIGAPSQAALVVQCPDIARRDLSSIRTYICGGSAVPVSVSNKLKEYLMNHSLTEAYGLSEFAGISNLNRWPQQKEGSVGRLTPNTKAKILTEDGEPLGVGETGEVHLCSPYQWSGYYGNPEMTRLTIDSDGWIRTGDLGYFDENGFLFICGRKKEILKYKNFQISPNEIEEIIMRIPGVLEVCVFGIQDKVAGDLTAAAIVKFPQSTLTEKLVYDTVASCVSDVKHLHGGVYFVPQLPKTPSGKVQRHKLLPIVAEMCKKN